MFSTGLTVSGIQVETSIPKGSTAWMKANSLFYPIGPGYSEAWLVLSGEGKDILTAANVVNDPHTIRWTIISDTNPRRTIVEFPGWYFKHAERVLQGGPEQAGSLFLARFVDIRHIKGINSDTGDIRSNIRSYAQLTEYLTESRADTWTTLVTSLWNNVGGLGAFPGLPAGLPIDGIPQTNFLIGLNGWAALNAVLEHLDCAIAPIPTGGARFTIVQLGSQGAFGNLPTPIQNFEPVRSNTHCAANLNFYFNKHYYNYGQEKDTELTDNWSVTGNTHVQAAATGIQGAIGDKPLWDDLPYIINLNGTDANSAARTTRITNRVSRYVTRQTCPVYHRIYTGINTTVSPGGVVKAVLFRNWDDGVDAAGHPLNDFGGTVTEWIAKPDYVNNQSEFLLQNALAESSRSHISQESYIAPDLSRRSYPNYPRLSQLVRINKYASPSSPAAGARILPNANGYFAGNVYRMVNGTMTQLEDCWILITDLFDTKAGQVEGIQHQFYVGRLMGQKLSEGLQKPLYVVQQGNHRSPAIAILEYALCGDTATFLSFEMLDGSTIDPVPTTADNSLFDHRGRIGDFVLLEWRDDAEEWIVVNVSKHEYDLYVGLRRVGDCDEFGCIEGQVIRAAIETCETEAEWRTIFCIPPCVDTSFQTSIISTSFSQTSNMQTSTIGCGSDEINPLLIPSGLGLQSGLVIQSAGTCEEAIRQVGITITDQAGCGTDIPGGPWTTQSPRDNSDSTITALASPPCYESIIQNANAYDPESPSYGQGFFDSYNLYCGPRRDVITNEVINPDDPTDVEWRLEGTFGTPTLGLGFGGSEVRVSETQGGANNPEGAGWVAMSGSLTVHSFNPFHAVAIFTPTSCYPNSIAGCSYGCGPVKVEFIETIV